MRARVIAIEKFAKCSADFKQAKTGETCGLLLEFIDTTEDATQTDPVDEQHDDGRVEAGKEEYSIIRIPYELINKPKSPPEG